MDTVDTFGHNGEHGAYVLGGDLASEEKSHSHNGFHGKKAVYITRRRDVPREKHIVAFKE